MTTTKTTVTGDVPTKKDDFDFYFEMIYSGACNQEGFNNIETLVEQCINSTLSVLNAREIYNLTLPKHYGN